jgi:hypothetical protein
MRKFTQYQNTKKRLVKGLKATGPNKKDQRSVRFSNYNPESNNSPV